MRATTVARTLAGPMVIVAVLGGGWWTKETWQGWLVRVKETDSEKDKEEPPDSPERVKLSPQAQRNLRLVVKEVQPTTYWRKIYLPGAVVDRPGHSDHGIPAPIAGVVISVNALPGRMVRPGDELFRLKITSESFQTSQMELYKYHRELEIAQKEHKRLEGLVNTGAVPNSKLLELDYQSVRFKALIHAHQQDLLTRQLTEEQIRSIEKGQFVTEIAVRMPERFSKPHTHGETQANFTQEAPVEYEVQDLKVNLGNHVQAGQILAYIADHRSLYIEGKALKQEARLLTQATKEGWPVEAEFSADDDDNPGERLTNLAVEFLGTTMDAGGLTLPVYIPFANPQKEYMRQGKTYRTGQYRPGQKVLLKVAVAKLTGVFVLPAAAVVREGADAYVFRQNGGVFDRKPVHVVAQDIDSVVIAKDGSIAPGDYIAQNAAAALNRVVKANQAEGGGGHHHDH